MDKDLSIGRILEMRNKMDVMITDIFNDFYNATGLAVHSVTVIQNKLLTGDDKIVDVKHKVIVSVGIDGGSSYE